MISAVFNINAMSAYMPQDLFDFFHFCH